MRDLTMTKNDKISNPGLRKLSSVAENEKGVIKMQKNHSKKHHEKSHKIKSQPSQTNIKETGKHRLGKNKKGIIKLD